jgi:hypothetical protein
LNQESAAFDAQDVVDQLSQDYGIDFTLEDVGEVILYLYEVGMLVADKCNKTLDLFNFFTGTKKPATTGNFAGKHLKKHRKIIAHNQICVIKRFKKRVEFNQSLAFSRLASLNFLDSGFFGGRYGY